MKHGHFHPISWWRIMYWLKKNIHCLSSYYSAKVNFFNIRILLSTSCFLSRFYSSLQRPVFLLNRNSKHTGYHALRLTLVRKKFGRRDSKNTFKLSASTHSTTAYCQVWLNWPAFLELYHFVPLSRKTVSCQQLFVWLWWVQVGFVHSGHDWFGTGFHEFQGRHVRNEKVHRQKQNNGTVERDQRKQTAKWSGDSAERKSKRKGKHLQLREHQMWKLVLSALPVNQWRKAGSIDWAWTNRKEKSQLLNEKFIFWPKQT